MSALLGRDTKVVEWIKRCGLDLPNTHRVILDIPMDGVVKVYVESYGDSRVFEVAALDLTGAKVITSGIKEPVP